MYCSKPLAAGLFGPLGLMAVYYYTENRQMITNHEVVLVQGVGSLPGVGLGILLKKLLARFSSKETTDSHQ